MVVDKLIELIKRACFSDLEEIIENADDKMKQVYLVLSYTGTMLAKIVRFYTKKEYFYISFIKCLLSVKY